MTSIEARFGHVNVTGHDWRRLAAFYTDVFGCEFVPPERDIRSADLDAGTGLRDAHLVESFGEIFLERIHLQRASQVSAERTSRLSQRHQMTV